MPSDSLIMCLVPSVLKYKIDVCNFDFERPGNKYISCFRFIRPTQFCSYIELLLTNSKSNNQKKLIAIAVVHKLSLQVILWVLAIMFFLCLCISWCTGVLSVFTLCNLYNMSNTFYLYYGKTYWAYILYYIIVIISHSHWLMYHECRCPLL